MGLWRVGAVATRGRPAAARKTSAKKINKYVNKKIRQHLPAVLRIHVLAGRVYCPENNRAVTPKLFLGPE